MEDEQEPTPANATSQWYGEGVDQGFAEQLKAARARCRMSQGRVADRMRKDFGFPWHQTTVAKTESGIRPILFREAVALAKLLNFDLNEALSPAPSAVDKWVYGQRLEIEGQERSLENAESAVRNLKYDLKKMKSALSFVEAVLRFDETRQVQPLVEDLVRVFFRDRFASLHAKRVLDPLGVPKELQSRAYLEAKVQSAMVDFEMDHDEALREVESKQGYWNPYVFPVVLGIEFATGVAQARGVELTEADVEKFDTLRAEARKGAKKAEEDRFDVNVVFRDGDDTPAGP
jgi:transcriptional regulator with XRE-family HTH domain